MGGTHSGRSLDLDLPAVPESCARARHAVRDALAATAVEPAPIELAVSEAVANAVVHAYRDRDEPGRVRLAVDVDAAGVSVVVTDDGVGMSPRVDSPGLGVGLSLIAEACDELEIEQLAGGTRVSMRFGLAPPSAAAAS